MQHTKNKYQTGGTQKVTKQSNISVLIPDDTADELDENGLQKPKKDKSLDDIFDLSRRRPIKPVTPGVVDILGKPVRIAATAEELGFTPRMNQPLSEQFKERAENQSTTEQWKNAMIGAVVGGGYGVIESAGYLSDIPQMLMIQQDLDKGYTNWLSEWAKDKKKELNDAYPIYREDPNAVFDFGDSGFWAQSAMGLGESALGFGVGGLGAAFTIGRLGAAGLGGMSKVLNASKAIQAGMANSGRMVSTSLAMNYVESMMMASELFDNVYKDAVANGIDEKTAIEEAGNRANRFIWTNKMTTFTDAFALKGLFKGADQSRRMIRNKQNQYLNRIAHGKYKEEAVPNIFWSKETLKDLGKNAPVEALEEVAAGAFQKEQEYIGKKNLGLDVDKYAKSFSGRAIDYAVSPEGRYEMLMGALGGGPQAIMVNKPFEWITEKVNNPLSKEQQTTLMTEQMSVISENKATLNQHLTSFSKIEKDKQDALEKNDITTYDSKREEGLAVLIKKNLVNGTEEDLRNRLLQIQEFDTAEDAAAAGYDGDYKKTITEALKTLDEYKYLFNDTYAKYALNEKTAPLAATIFDMGIAAHVVDKTLTKTLDRKKEVEQKISKDKLYRDYATQETLIHDLNKHIDDESFHLGSMVIDEQALRQHDDVNLKDKPVRSKEEIKNSLSKSAVDLKKAQENKEKTLKELISIDETITDKEYKLATSLQEDYKNILTNKFHDKIDLNDINSKKDVINKYRLEVAKTSDEQKAKLPYSLAERMELEKINNSISDLIKAGLHYDAIIDAFTSKTFLDNQDDIVNRAKQDYVVQRTKLLNDKTIVEIKTDILSRRRKLSTRENTVLKIGDLLVPINKLNDIKAINNKGIIYKYVGSTNGEHRLVNEYIDIKTGKTKKDIINISDDQLSDYVGYTNKFINEINNIDLRDENKALTELKLIKNRALNHYLKPDKDPSLTSSKIGVVTQHGVEYFAKNAKDRNTFLKIIYYVNEKTKDVNTAIEEKRDKQLKEAIKFLSIEIDPTVNSRLAIIEEEIKTILQQINDLINGVEDITLSDINQSIEKLKTRHEELILERNLLLDRRNYHKDRILAIKNGAEIGSVKTLLAKLGAVEQHIEILTKVSTFLGALRDIITDIRNFIIQQMNVQMNQFDYETADEVLQTLKDNKILNDKGDKLEIHPDTTGEFIINNKSVTVKLKELFRSPILKAIEIQKVLAELKDKSLFVEGSAYTSYENHLMKQVETLTAELQDTTNIVNQLIDDKSGNVVIKAATFVKNIIQIARHNDAARVIVKELESYRFSLQKDIITYSNFVKHGATSVEEYKKILEDIEKVNQENRDEYGYIIANGYTDEDILNNKVQVYRSVNGKLEVQQLFDPNTYKRDDTKPVVELITPDIYENVDTYINILEADSAYKARTKQLISVLNKAGVTGITEKTIGNFLKNNNVVVVYTEDGKKVERRLVEQTFKDRNGVDRTRIFAGEWWRERFYRSQPVKLLRNHSTQDTNYKIAMYTIYDSLYRINGIDRQINLDLLKNNLEGLTALDAASPSYYNNIIDLIETKLLIDDNGDKTVNVNKNKNLKDYFNPKNDKFNWNSIVVGSNTDNGIGVISKVESFDKGKRSIEYIFTNREGATMIYDRAGIQKKLENFDKKTFIVKAPFVKHHTIFDANFEIDTIKFRNEEYDLKTGSKIEKQQPQKTQPVPPDEETVIKEDEVIVAPPVDELSIDEDIEITEIKSDYTPSQINILPHITSLEKEYHKAMVSAGADGDYNQPIVVLHNGRYNVIIPGETSVTETGLEKMLAELEKITNEYYSFDNTVMIPLYEQLDVDFIKTATDVLAGSDFNIKSVDDTFEIRDSNNILIADFSLEYGLNVLDEERFSSIESVITPLLKDYSKKIDILDNEAINRVKDRDNKTKKLLNTKRGVDLQKAISKGIVGNNKIKQGAGNTVWNYVYDEDNEKSIISSDSEDSLIKLINTYYEKMYDKMFDQRSTVMDTKYIIFKEKVDFQGHKVVPGDYYNVETKTLTTGDGDIVIDLSVIDFHNATTTIQSEIDLSNNSDYELNGSYEYFKVDSLKGITDQIERSQIVKQIEKLFDDVNKLIAANSLDKAENQIEVIKNKLSNLDDIDLITQYNEAINQYLVMIKEQRDLNNIKVEKVIEVEEEILESKIIKLSENAKVEYKVVSYKKADGTIEYRIYKTSNEDKEVLKKDGKHRQVLIDSFVNDVNIVVPISNDSSDSDLEKIETNRKKSLTESDIEGGWYEDEGEYYGHIMINDDPPVEIPDSFMSKEALLDEINKRYDELAGITTATPEPESVNVITVGGKDYTTGMELSIKGQDSIIHIVSFNENDTTTLRNNDDAVDITITNDKLLEYDRIGIDDVERKNESVVENTEYYVQTAQGEFPLQPHPNKKKLEKNSENKTVSVELKVVNGKEQLVPISPSFAYRKYNYTDIDKNGVKTTTKGGTFVKPIIQAYKHTDENLAELQNEGFDVKLENGIFYLQIHSYEKANPAFNSESPVEFVFYPTDYIINMMAQEELSTEKLLAEHFPIFVRRSVNGVTKVFAELKASTNQQRLDILSQFGADVIRDAIKNRTIVTGVKGKLTKKQYSNQNLITVRAVKDDKGDIVEPELENVIDGVTTIILPNGESNYTIEKAEYNLRTFKESYWFETPDDVNSPIVRKREGDEGVPLIVITTRGLYDLVTSRAIAGTNPGLSIHNYTSMAEVNSKILEKIKTDLASNNDLRREFEGVDITATKTKDFSANLSGSLWTVILDPNGTFRAVVLNSKNLGDEGAKFVMDIFEESSTAKKIDVLGAIKTSELTKDDKKAYETAFNTKEKTAVDDNLISRLEKEAGITQTPYKGGLSKSQERDLQLIVFDDSNPIVNPDINEKFFRVRYVYKSEKDTSENKKVNVLYHSPFFASLKKFLVRNDKSDFIKSPIISITPDYMFHGNIHQAITDTDLTKKDRNELIKSINNLSNKVQLVEYKTVDKKLKPEYTKVSSLAEDLKSLGSPLLKEFIKTNTYLTNNLPVYQAAALNLMNDPNTNIDTQVKIVLGAFTPDVELRAMLKTKSYAVSDEFIYNNYDDPDNTEIKDPITKVRYTNLHEYLIGTERVTTNLYNNNGSFYYDVALTFELDNADVASTFVNKTDAEDIDDTPTEDIEVKCDTGNNKEFMDF